MNDHTKGGCSCTPNTAIKCTVTACANHCSEAQYCGLDTIQIGTHGESPLMTDCLSFRKG